MYPGNEFDGDSGRAGAGADTPDGHGRDRDGGKRMRGRKKVWTALDVAQAMNGLKRQVPSI